MGGKEKNKEEEKGEATSRVQSVLDKIDIGDDPGSVGIEGLSVEEMGELLDQVILDNDKALEECEEL